MANIEPFNLNENLLFYYYYDDVYELEMEWVKESNLMASFISTFSTLSTFESIATPSDNMGNGRRNCMGIIENSIDPKLDGMGPSPYVLSPLSFFCGEWWQDAKSCIASKYVLFHLPLCLLDI